MHCVILNCGGGKQFLFLLYILYSIGLRNVIDAPEFLCWKRSFHFHSVQRNMPRNSSRVVEPGFFLFCRSGARRESGEDRRASEERGDSYSI